MRRQDETIDETAVRVLRMSAVTRGRHHHRCETAIEAVGGVAAHHRAVGVRGVGARSSAGGGAVGRVPHVHLSSQLTRCRMRYQKIYFNGF